MALIAVRGPCQPRKRSSLASSASVAWKNFSSSPIARLGKRRISIRSPSNGERSGTTKRRSLRSLVRPLTCSTCSTPMGRHARTRPDHEHIKGIAIIGLGARYETPIIRIGQSGQQWLGKGESAKLRVEFELGAAAARRLDHGINPGLVRPGRKLRVIRHMRKFSRDQPPRLLL
jgi:hypothetical protein